MQGWKQKMRAKEFIKENRDIHVIAVDQTVDTENGRVPNPDIKNWAVQAVANNANLAMLWKTPENNIEMDSEWFGKMTFNDLYGARDYIQSEYDKINFN